MHRPAIDHDPTRPTRRHVLAGAAGLALAPMLPATPARATPETLKAAIKTIVGEGTLQQGKVKLDLPPLVENGNAVPLTIDVDSPMTDADHVKAIHVFTEKNPQPYVVSFKLGPRAGKASVSTRIRLADTQHVVAIAQTSDGTFWTDSIEVVVTLAACLEES
ncbi:MAG: SoxY-related AACIE arm protein [Xanthobacteraceae bacterium]